MERFIKLSNAIWSCGLGSAELQAYIAIKAFANCFGHCCVKHETMAAAVGVSVPTIARAVKKLSDRRLISVGKRFNREGRAIANSYTLTALQGSFTMVPANILQYRLPKSVFKVYLYLLRCRNTNSLEALPSLSQMASVLRMSKRTIVDAIAALSGSLLLHKERYRHKQDRRLGHNRYRVLTDTVRRCLAVLLAGKRARKERRAALIQRATRHAIKKVGHLYEYRIALVVRKVKDFLRGRAFLFRSFVGTILIRQ